MHMHIQLLLWKFILPIPNTRSFSVDMYISFTPSQPPSIGVYGPAAFTNSARHAY